MNRLALIVAALLAGLTTLHATEPIPTHTREGLRYPVDITRRITSTYGEYRADRFHAGLDFSINNQVGAPAYAIDDGHIFRLKVGFTGYGLVLYLTLDSGDIAVYAHLDEFAENIEDRVRAEQQRQGRYEVEMWFEPGELRFKQGDLLAYCGGSGAGAPHLHFELRTPSNVPYNPVLAGLRYEDTKAPWLRRLAVTPLDGDSEADGGTDPVIRWVSEGVASPVSVFGRVGISAEPRDFQDGGWYKLGVSEFELFLGDSLIHHTVLDTFPYSLNRHSRLDFDYELIRRGYRKFRRLYIAEGNRLPFYDRSIPGAGVIDTRDLPPGTHIVRVRVTDANGNQGEVTLPLDVRPEPALPLASVPDSLPPMLEAEWETVDLPFFIRTQRAVAHVHVPDVPDSLSLERLWIAGTALSHPKTLQPLSTGGYTTRAPLDPTFSGWMPFELVGIDSAGQVYKSRRELYLIGMPARQSRKVWLPDEGLRLAFPGTGLPQDLVAQLEVLPKEDETLAPLFRLTPGDYPFLKTFDLSLTAPPDSSWDEHSVLVYRGRDNAPWQFLSNDRELDGSHLHARVFSLETFSVQRDTVPPTLGNASPGDGVAFRNRRPVLGVSVDDAFSGLDIERSSLTVNGETVIWEYDPDSDRMFYEPWSDLAPGEYTWRVELWDRANNRSVLERSFVIGR